MLPLLFALLAAPPDTLNLTFRGALAVALKHSPALTEVSVSKSQSVLKPVAGIGALLPTPSATLTYGHSESKSPFFPDSTVTTKGWTGSVGLSQVVFDPQVFAAVAGSFVYSGYYLAEARDKQARLIYDVVTDYLNLLRAHLLREATASTLARAEDNLRLNREKLRLGAASRIDVMRSEVAKSQVEIELLSADKVLGSANAAFLATAGISKDVVVIPSEKLTEPSGLALGNADSLLAEVERRNPGASLAARANTVSRLNQAAAIGRALPSVSAYWSSSFTDTLFPDHADRWRDNDDISYGVRLSFPLLDLKSYVLGIADASLAARQARAGAVRAKLQLRSAATAAILGYKEACQRYQYAQRNLELSRELFRLAEEQCRLGALSLIDFQSVETGLSQAQAAHVSALCDTHIQAAQISYLLGRTEY